MTYAPHQCSAVRDLGSLNSLGRRRVLFVICSKQTDRLRPVTAVDVNRLRQLSTHFGHNCFAGQRLAEVHFRDLVLVILLWIGAEQHLDAREEAVFVEPDLRIAGLEAQ